MAKHEPMAEHPESRQLPDYPADGGNDGPIVIANEFVDAVVRRVATRNGVRLEIWSPRRGSRILLDAVALDCLSFQDPDLISQLLARNPGQ